MAITTTADTLQDMPRNIVMQFTGISDGSGNETNVVKVSKGKGVKIRKITSTINGPGMVTLKWSASTPVVFAQIAPGAEAFDYTKWGGMENHSDGNGDILLSTNYFGLGSSYMILLEMQRS